MKEQNIRFLVFSYFRFFLKIFLETKKNAPFLILYPPQDRSKEHTVTSITVLNSNNSDSEDDIPLSSLPKSTAPHCIRDLKPNPDNLLYTLSNGAKIRYHQARRPLSKNNSACYLTKDVIKYWVRCCCDFDKLLNYKLKKPLLDKALLMNFKDECHPVEEMPKLYVPEGSTGINGGVVRSSSSGTSSSQNSGTPVTTKKPFHGNQYTRTPEQIAAKKEREAEKALRQAAKRKGTNLDVLANGNLNGHITHSPKRNKPQTAIEKQAQTILTKFKNLNKQKSAIIDENPNSNEVKNIKNLIQARELANQKINILRSNFNLVLPDKDIDEKLKEPIVNQLKIEIEKIRNFLKICEAREKNDKARLLQIKLDEEKRLRMQRVQQRPLFLEAMKDWASPQEDLVILNDSSPLVRPIGWVWLKSIFKLYKIC